VLSEGIEKCLGRNTDGTGVVGKKTEKKKKLCAIRG
jgi:hypothetical protein